MKILIADDNAHNRMLLDFILRDHDFDTIEAVNGQEACDILAEDENIDLVLMDLNMPVLDGIQATQKIKQEICVNRFIPVLFVTAQGENEYLEKCLEAGGDDFVKKPVDEIELLAKVRAHSRTLELYNKLHKVNQQLEYHNSLVEQEHRVVEHIFRNGAERLKTYCDNVTTYTSPVSMFNGDVVLQSPSPSGGVYVLLGDFTGHGLASSIGTLPVYEIFFRLAERGASVSQFATEINKSLVKILPITMFMCSSIMHLDRDGKSLLIWSGGMNDTLVVDKHGGEVKHIEAAHMPLGILSAKEFDDETTHVQLNENDVVFSYTDGVNEAFNAEGEEFGLERLEALVEKGGNGIVERVEQSVHEFKGDFEQTDDLSCLSLNASSVVHHDKKTDEIVDVGERFHSVQGFPFSVSMSLSGDDLKQVDVVDQLMQFSGSVHGIELHKDKLFTVISELFSNALEHGVLGIESSIKDNANGFEQYYTLREERLNTLTDDDKINIDFKFSKGDPSVFELMIQDSGKGFDSDKLLEKLEHQEFHGRGLGLLKSMCSVLEYRDQGRTVFAKIPLKR